MKGQVRQAPSHSLLRVIKMGKKKSVSAIEIEVVYAGTPEQTQSIIRSLLKTTIENVLKKNGAVAYNLDEVLDKYISEEMRNGRKG